MRVVEFQGLVYLPQLPPIAGGLFEFGLIVYVADLEVAYLPLRSTRSPYKVGLLEGIPQFLSADTSIDVGLVELDNPGASQPIDDGYISLFLTVAIEEFEPEVITSGEF
jgi:hypothetical protein